MERRLKTLKELREELMGNVFDWSYQNIKSKDEIPLSYVMYSFENREFVEYIWNRVNSVFQRIKEVSLLKHDIFKDLQYSLSVDGVWRENDIHDYTSGVYFTDKGKVIGGKFYFNSCIASHESESLIAFSLGHEIAHFMFGDFDAKSLVENCVRLGLKNNGDEADKYMENVMVAALCRGMEARADFAGYNFVKQAGYQLPVSEIGYDFQNTYQCDSCKYTHWNTPHSALYVDVGILDGVHHPLNNARIDVLKKNSAVLPSKLPTMRFYDFWEIQMEYIRQYEEHYKELDVYAPKRSLKETSEQMFQDAAEILQEQYDENEKNMEYFLNGNFEREWYVRQAIALNNNLTRIPNVINKYPSDTRLLLLHKKALELKIQGEHFRELLLNLLNRTMDGCETEFYELFNTATDYVQYMNSSTNLLWDKNPDLNKCSDLALRLQNK